MTITVTFKTTCDGCGLAVTKIIEIDQWDAKVGEVDENGVIYATYRRLHRQMGDECVPNGWMIHYGDKSGLVISLFHSQDCYRDWLAKQGRYEDIARFDNAEWIA